MTHLLLVTQIIALLLPNWQEFLSTEGRFSIMTPGTLVEKVDVVQTPIGEMKYHTFFYRDTLPDAENLFYMVSYSDYPENTFHQDSTELMNEFFQNTMEAAAESVDGELIYSSEIELDGYQGRVWRIDYQGGKSLIKSRAFLVGQRYYAVQTVSDLSKNLNPSATRFFDSFKVISKS